MDGYRTNDGSLEWDVILTFDPATWSDAQKGAMRRRERELQHELWEDHVAGMRENVTGPDDDAEFSQMVLDPK